MRTVSLWALTTSALVWASIIHAAPLSHPPLVTMPRPAERPLAQAPTVYADAARGDDANPGTVDKPFRTVMRGLQAVKPGATLCLRGGTYHEQVHVARVGTSEAPITIRSYPGELAVIDAGWPVFFTDPAKAWEPVPGTDDEFVSAAAYPNVHQVLGSLGDSMIGLQTYYHAQDLRSRRHQVDYADWEKSKETDILDLYVGPGVWYDPQTGRIHARLAHTDVEGIDNYRGPTDPRQVPMVLAPFHAVPLTLEGSEHVIIQDLVIRGGGYNTIISNLTQHVTLDNVTVWAGAYGMLATGTRHLKLHRCGFYGNVAPFTFRSDGSKRDYPGRPTRNISRLNTHALIVPDGIQEWSVYATPLNDHWEISYCDFVGAHDGLYLGAINTDYHHNLMVNMQDDGLYLSPMYRRHKLEKEDPVIRVHENWFSQVNMPLAFGGSEPETRDTVYVYRNVFDQRGPLNYSRPSTKDPQLRRPHGGIMGDHGSPPWPAMTFYHNTMIVEHGARAAHFYLASALHPDRPRRVFNNLFLHTANLPAYPQLDPAQNVQADGNLLWSATLKGDPAAYFNKYRKSPLFEQSKEVYADGFSTHSLVADPQLGLGPWNGRPGDYTLKQGSPAIDAGVALPGDWTDPLRSADAGKPDIGALPLGAGPLKVGRYAPQ